MILVDSSVWIQYFREGDDVLDVLIKENLVCTNDVIMTELLPGAQHHNQHELIYCLESITKFPLDIDWIGIQKLQSLNYSNGINKVGIPDLIILQQALDRRLELYTLDKHFKLMSQHVDLRLF